MWKNVFAFYVKKGLVDASVIVIGMIVRDDYILFLCTRNFLKGGQQISLNPGLVEKYMAYACSSTLRVVLSARTAYVLLVFNVCLSMFAQSLKSNKGWQYSLLILCLKVVSVGARCLGRPLESDLGRLGAGPFCCGSS